MERSNASFKAGSTSSLASTILFILLTTLTGCHGSYSTPGQPAEFSDLGLSIQSEDMTARERDSLTDRQIEQRLDTRPLASFPAGIVYAQVQGSGYSWRGRSTYGTGNTTIVDTHHDAEMEAAIRSLSEPALPGVKAIGALSPLIVPTYIRDHSDLRAAAASLQADMLLLYTFDTQVTDDELIPYVGLLSLGMFPDRVARATSNAFAILIDTRNGYIYGTATGHAQADKLSNFLGSDEAFDKALKRVEAQAMHDLSQNMRRTWAMILDQHAPQLAAQTEKPS